MKKKRRRIDFEQLFEDWIGPLLIVLGVVWFVLLVSKWLKLI